MFRSIDKYKNRELLEAVEWVIYANTQEPKATEGWIEIFTLRKQQEMQTSEGFIAAMEYLFDTQSNTLIKLLQELYYNVLEASGNTVQELELNGRRIIIKTNMMN